MENGSELCHWKGQLVIGLRASPVLHGLLQLIYLRHGLSAWPEAINCGILKQLYLVLLKTPKVAEHVPDCLARVPAILRPFWHANVRY